MLKYIENQFEKYTQRHYEIYKANNVLFYYRKMNIKYLVSYEISGWRFKLYVITKIVVSGS